MISYLVLLICEEFSKCMHSEFEMSMRGELRTSNQTTQGWYLINEEKYTKDLLKRYKFNEGKIAKTLLSTSTKLDKDEKGKNVDIKAYRDMIGSLLYLTASRPDIMFSVYLCARFQSCPKESHLHAVKRIFKYLFVTIDLGLWYPRNVELNW